MAVSFPITYRTLSAITKKEPIALYPCRSRSISLLNAAIYPVRVFVDPPCGACLIIAHLFKALYHISLEDNAKQKAKNEGLKALDYVLLTVCSPIFNLILTGKCFASTIQPTICYRQATPKERVIILRFHRYQQRGQQLGIAAVKDLKNFNFRTRIHKRIKRLNQESEQTRIAYFRMKLYTI